MKKRKPIPEMSDRELQEGLYQNIRTITGKTRSTNGWVTFIGIVLIVQILSVFIFLIESS